MKYFEKQIIENNKTKKERTKLNPHPHHHPPNVIFLEWKYFVRFISFNYFFFFPSFSFFYIVSFNLFRCNAIIIIFVRKGVMLKKMMMMVLLLILVSMILVQFVVMSAHLFIHLLCSTIYIIRYNINFMFCGFYFVFLQVCTFLFCFFLNLWVGLLNIDNMCVNLN